MNVWICPPHFLKQNKYFYQLRISGFTTETIKRLKVLHELNCFGCIFLESFCQKSNLSSIHKTWWLIWANVLFSFGEIIAQTIKIFFTGCGQNFIKKERMTPAYHAPAPSTIIQIPAYHALRPLVGLPTMPQTCSVTHSAK